MVTEGTATTSWKRGDIHPVTGLCFWQYTTGRASERWITKEKLAEYRAKSDERHLRWRTSNRDYVRQTSRNWQKLNREKVCSSSKRWRQKTPERQALYSIQYKHRKRANIGDLALAPSIYQTANRLSKCLGIPFDVDHIIPLSRGGRHDYRNLQVLPRTLNLRKLNHLNFKLPDCWISPSDLISSNEPK